MPLLFALLLLCLSSAYAEDTDVKPIQVRVSTLKTEQYPIDLSTALKLIEDQNLMIAQDQKNSEVVKSRYRQSQAALLPNIEGSYTQSRLEGGQQVFGDVVTVIRKTVQPQLTASWTLYPGGKTIFDMLAARRRTQSANYLVKGTYQDQLSQATQDYYKLLAAYRQKDVALEALSLSEEQVKSNQALVDVGKGIPLDLSRAKTDYAQRQSTLVQSETAIIQAEQTLLNRLNLDPDIHLIPAELNLADETKKLIPQEEPVEKLIATAIDNNQAIKTGEADLKALGLDYKSVFSEIIPSVTVRSYVNGTGPKYNALTKTTFAGVTVNMNLLDNLGLQIPFRLQEKKKLIEQKTLAQQQLIRDTQSAVMTAYLSSENQRSAIEAAQQAVKSAEESYDLASGRYNAGYGINLDVLDARSALVTAKNTLIQAMLTYNQAQVQLVGAMGLVTPANLTQGIDTLPKKEAP